MSDDERLSLRDLPALEPIEPPERMSQTFLRYGNRCKRSAYLYLRHRGGTPAHELDFGTAAHVFFERAMLELIEREESSLVAVGATQGPGGEIVPEDPLMAKRAVASLTAAMLDEILRERTDLTIPAAHPTHSVDHLREIAYHWAVGLDVEPGGVVAVERKFVLDLDCGVTVSGKVDLASMAGDVAQVDDYKSTFAIPSQEEFENSFQVKLYAVLLLFGHPVDTGADGGLVLLPPLGEGVQWVRGRELYPRYLTDQGEVRSRSVVFSRQELVDFRYDVERLAEDLLARCSSGKWPAVPGSHCSECPCEPECPLPKHLRRWAGAINSMEQASEALEWAERMGDRVSATKEEAKRFAKAHGPIPVGRDLVWEFSPVESWKTDWPALETGVERAAVFGEPFDLGDVRRRQVSTRFVKRKLSDAEINGDGNGRAAVAARDFGDDPPF